MKSTRKPFATFRTDRRLHDMFKAGPLMEAWAAAYPMLFDERDVANARNQREGGYHYHEWLAAILLLHTRGYLSLMKKYACRSHPRKRTIVEHVVPGELLPLFTTGVRSKVRHWPDLLVYSSLADDWFFCEVKGPTDTVRDAQEPDFRLLERETGKPVQVIKLVENSSRGSDSLSLSLSLRRRNGS